MFLLVIIAFVRHSQGSVGIECVIGQFLASQDHIVDTIFEWLEFLVEVQTKKKPKKYHEKKNRKKPNTTANFKFGTGFFGFFSCNPPPPPHWPSHGHHLLPLALTKPLFSPNLPSQSPDSSKKPSQLRKVPI